jgi:PIN domain nuclease of toxin-antitoxin system
MKLNLLLDTHVVIWMASSPRKIPTRMLAAIEKADHRFVSDVTAFEIQLKHQKNREEFPFSLSHLELTMKEFACTGLPITYNDIRTIGQIQALHSDPFDRLLMAQAANRNVYLATVDEQIIQSFTKYAVFSVFSDRAMKGSHHS